MTLNELEKKYQMALDEHARKFHSNIMDESAYRDSCRKLRELRAEMEKVAEKEGKPIAKFI